MEKNLPAIFWSGTIVYQQREPSGYYFVKDVIGCPEYLKPIFLLWAQIADIESKIKAEIYARELIRNYCQGEVI